MKSTVTDKFRKAFDRLPKDVQQKARKSYQQWKLDAAHPSLHFKQVHLQRPIYSVRIGLAYRALGLKEQETMIWFWIGSHEDYNQLVRQF